MSIFFFITLSQGSASVAEDTSFMSRYNKLSRLEVSAISAISDFEWYVIGYVSPTSVCWTSRTIQSFNILKEKVICLTTGNAANTLKTAEGLAFSQIGYYIHKWNLVVTDCLFIFFTKKVKKIVTSFHSSTVATFALKSDLKINGL